MRNFILLVGLSFWALRVLAAEPFVISDIRVEGLQRIAAGTVFNYLPLKVGDEADDDSIRESITALYDTGFFEDVQLKREGTVLVVQVDERPSIAEITFEGNDDIDDETLRQVLTEIGLEERRVFNPVLLDQLVQELQNQYFSRGKYAADVSADIEDLERNRVAIRVTIDEGEAAKIRGINIIGNESFDDETLLDEFSQSTPGWFDYFTKSSQYSKQKLSADIETLRSFYQDQGYLDFEVQSTQVSITPDKRDIYITITIREGERYQFADYSFSGKTIIEESELRDLVAFEPGDVFSRQLLTQSTKAIADRLADEGYAFSNVNAVPSLDREAREVSFLFSIDPGRRVYVRRININGNISTQDEVIRREMRQLEGAWFSAEKVRRSRVRLQRLGFFDDISIETPAVPGSPDQVDVNVTVRERRTGSALIGVGVSDAEGALFQASVQQTNLFGTGRELEARFDTTSVTQIISFEYRNPYYTESGISRGFNVFKREIDAEEADTAEYVTDTLGGGIDYEVPFTEFDSLRFGLGFERVDLESTPETPDEILSFIEESPTNELPLLSAAFTHDTRDSILFPTEGVIHRLSGEASVFSSDQDYYKLNLETTWYWPVWRSLTFKVGGGIGYGDGYSSTQELPFFKNFFAGGSSTVRGYQARSLGPRDSGPTPEPLGGDKRLLGNIELLFPVPGRADEKDKRLSAFIDAGQVYGADQSFDMGELRYSAGVAFNWFSPLGPIAISIAQPLNDKTGDETERVQFSIGRFLQ